MLGLGTWIKLGAALAVVAALAWSHTAAYRAGPMLSAVPRSSDPSTFFAKGTPPMRQFAIWTMLLFAGLSAAGCQTTAPVSECDGWRKLTPAASTRDFIIRNDRPFAEQVAAHNTFGTARGCWK